MSELRTKMIKDMEIRGYSPTTVKHYQSQVMRLAQHFKKSPDLLGEDEIYEYLHYCTTEKN